MSYFPVVLFHKLLAYDNRIYFCVAGNSPSSPFLRYAMSRRDSAERWRKFMQRSDIVTASGRKIRGNLVRGWTDLNATPRWSIKVQLAEEQGWASETFLYAASLRRVQGQMVNCARTGLRANDPAMTEAIEVMVPDTIRYVP